MGLLRIACVISFLGCFPGCESAVCFGDSCSCYGDPEAPNANAGCAKCTAEAVCEALEERVRACGVAWNGGLGACESRVRAEHSCIENADTTPCEVLSVACPTNDSSCFAELVTSGVTACEQGLSSGAIVECPSRRCVDGQCVECTASNECSAGEACNAEGKCVPRCETDADCGPLSRCFANECDPPLGTACAGPFSCGTRFCKQLPGQPQPICTKACSPACAPGGFCACPTGFACSGTFCAPA